MTIITAFLASHAISTGLGALAALLSLLSAKYIPGLIKKKIVSEIEELLLKCQEKPHLKNWIIVTAQVIEIEIPDNIDFESRAEALCVKYPKLRPAKSAIVKILIASTEAVNAALKEEVKKNTK